jgi:hypothetical protein
VWTKSLKAQYPDLNDQTGPDPDIAEAMKVLVEVSVTEALLESRANPMDVCVVCRRVSSSNIVLSVVCSEAELDTVSDCLAVLDERFAYGSAWGCSL